MAETGQDAVHQRLQVWAQWVSTQGGGAGFPSTNVLHQSWVPPARGGMPGLRVAQQGDARVRETQQAVGALGLRLRNTVVVHYLQRVPLAEQARRLDCQPSTVGARVREARRLIGMHLDALRRGEF